MHSKKTILFSDGYLWIKKDMGLFDVTMESYDGAETWELVDCYMLSLVNKLYPDCFGLYRDDGLGIVEGSSKENDKIKKVLRKLFLDNGLRLVIVANKNIVNLLDITIDIKSKTYKPFKKPNNKIVYVNTSPNHPRSIINNIPEGINKRLNNICAS